MKIAVHTPFDPSKPIAELELFARLSLAAERLGWICRRTSDTRAIEAFAPDVVLAEHFRVAKLTDFPTLGLLCNPPAFWSNNDEFLKNIISYDGHLFADDVTRRYVADFTAPLCVPRVEGTWFPTCQETTLSNGQRSGLAYLATRWDGDRKADLITAIARKVTLHSHGPPSSRNRYTREARNRVQIPFDGTSVIAELSGRMAALCLHHPHHRRIGTPSARVFEAAAAGAIIISDENPFVRKTFGDAALYVDVDAFPEKTAEAVARHLAWLGSEPDAAAGLRVAAHRIFVERFSFDVLLRQLPDLVRQVHSAWRPPRRLAETSVALIVRTGGRDRALLDRAIRSLEQQTHPNIRAIIVAYRNFPDVRRWIEERRPKLAFCKVVESEDSGLRSTSLWTGLENVDAEFFGILDDDDGFMPNHVTSCLRALDAYPEMAVAFGGTIVVNEDENRATLRYFSHFDPKRFQETNFIPSNAWLGRKSLLARIGDDPMLVREEDYYLLLRFMKGNNFIPTWRATAKYNTRWSDAMRSPVDYDSAKEARAQIARRTYFSATRYTHPVRAKPLAVVRVLFDYLTEVPNWPRRTLLLRKTLRSDGLRGLYRLINARIG